jgi:predicted ArsR family transcriptional regulator
VDIPGAVERRLRAGLGPEPTRWDQRPSVPSRAVGAVLDLLATQSQPVTAAALAQLSGQHPNTVREHLDALVDGGLATRERAPASGRGRPAWLYAAAPQAEPASHEYAGLATALATQLSRTSPDPRATALEAGRAWGEQLATDGHRRPGSAAGARREVVDLLDGLGFAPSADARAMTVRLRRCPLLEAARELPEVVCSVHLGIVRGALDTWETRSAQTTLVPFAEPGACVLHLSGATSRSASGSGSG